MSRRGSLSAILLNLPPYTPSALLLQTVGSLSSAGELPSLGCAKDLSSPVSEMHISLRIRLAGRQGVSATTGAQVGFAKHLITKPGFVPTKPHGCPSELLFTCLELGVSLITASALDPSL